MRTIEFARKRVRQTRFAEILFLNSDKTLSVITVYLRVNSSSVRNSPDKSLSLPVEGKKSVFVLSEE